MTDSPSLDQQTQPEPSETTQTTVTGGIQQPADSVNSPQPTGSLDNGQAAQSADAPNNTRSPGPPQVHLGSSNPAQVPDSDLENCAASTNGHGWRSSMRGVGRYVLFTLGGLALAALGSIGLWAIGEMAIQADTADWGVKLASFRAGGSLQIVPDTLRAIFLALVVVGLAVPFIVLALRLLAAADLQGKVAELVLGELIKGKPPRSMDKDASGDGGTRLAVAVRMAAAITAVVSGVTLGTGAIAVYKIESRFEKTEKRIAEIERSYRADAQIYKESVVAVGEGYQQIANRAIALQEMTIERLTAAALQFSNELGGAVRDAGESNRQGIVEAGQSLSNATRSQNELRERIEGSLAANLKASKEISSGLATEAESLRKFGEESQRLESERRRIALDAWLIDQEQLSRGFGRQFVDSFRGFRSDWVRLYNRPQADVCSAFKAAAAINDLKVMEVEGEDEVTFMLENAGCASSPASSHGCSAMVTTPANGWTRLEIYRRAGGSSAPTCGLDTHTLRSLLHEIDTRVGG